MTSETPLSPPSPLPDLRLLWKPLVESVECHVAVIDPQRRLLFLNHCTEGYSSEQQILGRDMLDFIPVDRQEFVGDRLSQVFGDGRIIQYELAGTDPAGVDAHYAVRVAPVVDDERVVAAVVTALDTRRLDGAEASLVAERTVLRKLIETQERERQLVSYEIHDGLAQYLASALMRFESCADALATLSETASIATDPIARDAGTADVRRSATNALHCQRDCEEGLRLLRAALVEARRLINGLRPPMLDELGIVEAIESLVADARLEVPEVVFEKPDSLPRLSPDLETTIFRIVQEAITNVRKHADARRVSVTLDILPRGSTDPAGPATRGLRVAVQDDGRGFDPGSIPPTCFGLEGIRQRARLFGSEAVITSRPRAVAGPSPGDTPGGTQVAVILPLPDPPGSDNWRPQG